MLTDMTKQEFNKINIAYKGRLQPNIPAEDSSIPLLKHNQCLSAQENQTACMFAHFPVHVHESDL